MAAAARRSAACFIPSQRDDPLMEQSLDQTVCLFMHGDEDEDEDESSWSRYVWKLKIKRFYSYRSIMSTKRDAGLTMAMMMMSSYNVQAVTGCL